MSLNAFFVFYFISYFYAFANQRAHRLDNVQLVKIKVNNICYYYLWDNLKDMHVLIFNDTWTILVTFSLIL